MHGPVGYVLSSGGLGKRLAVPRWYCVRWWCQRAVELHRCSRKILPSVLTRNRCGRYFVPGGVLVRWQCSIGRCVPRRFILCRRCQCPVRVHWRCRYVLSAVVHHSGRDSVSAWSHLCRRLGRCAALPCWEVLHWWCGVRTRVLWPCWYLLPDFLQRLQRCRLPPRLHVRGWCRRARAMPIRQVLRWRRARRSIVCVDARDMVLVNCWKSALPGRLLLHQWNGGSAMLRASGQVLPSGVNIGVEQLCGVPDRVRMRRGRGACERLPIGDLLRVWCRDECRVHGAAGHLLPYLLGSEWCAVPRRPVLYGRRGGALLVRLVVSSGPYALSVWRRLVRRGRRCELRWCP